MEKEFVIGVTGASGVCYARRLLEVVCRDAKVHIIVSDVAQQIAAHEGVSFEGLNATYHAINKIAAPIASGFRQLSLTGWWSSPAAQRRLQQLLWGMQTT